MLFRSLAVSRFAARISSRLTMRPSYIIPHTHGSTGAFTGVLVSLPGIVFQRANVDPELSADICSHCMVSTACFIVMFSLPNYLWLLEMLKFPVYCCTVQTHRSYTSTACDRRRVV